MKSRAESVFLRFALSVVALLLLVDAAFAQSAPADVTAFLEGSRLNRAQAEAVEKTLARSPEDVVSHCKLIPYYFFNDESQIKWQTHLFWLIDHHPESEVFDNPVPTTYMVRTNDSQLPSTEGLLEFKHHWEHAAAAHPMNAAVLLHAAMAFSGQGLNNTANVSAQDHDLGFAYARKAVEADPKCTRCRNMVGSFIGSAILGLPGNLVGNWTCLPKTPEVVKTVSELRKEIELSADPEIIIDSGLMIRSNSGAYGSRCGGNRAEASAYGMKLIRKAVGLDPSLIDRRYLRDILKSAH